jgi:Mg2+ and Co2+ transporter CorA
MAAGGGTETERGVVTAYLFDQSQGKKIESWTDEIQSLGQKQLLWLDLVDPSDDEAREVRNALKLDEAAFSEAASPKATIGLAYYRDHLRVTAIAVSDIERDPGQERVVVDCFVGDNWVLTVHSAQVAVLEDFQELVAGEGQIGILDAPTFLAEILEWVVASYLRAFDEIEEELEEFDVSALTTPSNKSEERIGTLVQVRTRVGRLRRALAPHRELFAALSHSEFDPISSEGSAERFAELGSKVDAALASARDAKDGIASSFDVLLVRTEHRTNEIVKILTLASILLLPGALLAGVAGMNVNFKPTTFLHSGIFWVVVVAIVLTALVTLAFARLRKWI